MHGQRQELRVGLFIVIPILLILAVISLKLGYSFAGSTMDIYLKLDSIKSIQEGTAVKVKGYTVGRVVDILPVYEPDLHFLAVLRVERQIALHEDCSAIIMNQNVIGDAIIELRNPDRKGALLREGDVLEGIEYVNFEELLNNVNTLLTTVTETVNVVKGISLDSKGNLRRMLVNLAESAETANKTLSGSQQNIVDTTAAFRETAQTMQEISKEFKEHPVDFMMK